MLAAQSSRLSGRGLHNESIDQGIVCKCANLQREQCKHPNCCKTVQEVMSLPSLLDCFPYPDFSCCRDLHYLYVLYEADKEGRGGGWGGVGLGRGGGGGRGRRLGDGDDGVVVEDEVGVPVGGPLDHDQDAQVPDTQAHTHKHTHMHATHTRQHRQALKYQQVKCTSKIQPERAQRGRGEPGGGQEIDNGNRQAEGELRGG